MPKRVRFSPKYSESLNRWVLNIPPNLSKTGKRARLFFDDREEALKAARRMKERHQKFGASLATLDPVRLGEASEAYKLLKSYKERTGVNLTLLSVVRHFLAREAQKDPFGYRS